MIDWTRATKDEVLKINSIVKRVMTFDEHLDFQALQMDLAACHTHGCPLDLDGLLAARDADLLHDVYGIRRYIDRETGELCDCFVPRLTRPECPA